MWSSQLGPCFLEDSETLLLDNNHKQGGRGQAWGFITPVLRLRNDHSPRLAADHECSTRELRAHVTFGTLEHRNIYLFKHVYILWSSELKLSTESSAILIRSTSADFACNTVTHARRNRRIDHGVGLTWGYEGNDPSMCLCLLPVPSLHVLSLPYTHIVCDVIQQSGCGGQDNCVGFVYLVQCYGLRRTGQHGWQYMESDRIVSQNTTCISDQMLHCIRQNPAPL